MAKYMILFTSSLSAREQMAQATPEQMQASMTDWMTWKDNLDTSIGFEWGMPIQPVASVTTGGVNDSSSTVSGYAIMEGEKDVIAAVLQSHPHLKRADATVEVLQMLSMPGM